MKYLLQGYAPARPKRSRLIRKHSTPPRPKHIRDVTLDEMQQAMQNMGG